MNTQDLITAHFNRLTHHQGTEITRGIFSDVADTLLGGPFGGRGNQDLITFLNGQHAAGIPVTIFSAYPSAMQDELLVMLGLSPDLAHVRHKKNYVGQTLELMIDDAPYKGIQAVTHWHPHDKSIRHFLSHHADTRTLKR